MTTPQTTAGRTLLGDMRDIFGPCKHDGIPEQECWRPLVIALVEREATEHVLEVAAHVLPPTDVSALRDALREAQK